MRHLIICPELPPAPIPAGGIGTYVANISRLLAEAGETVHVIGQLWEGAPRRIEARCDGRLLIHRVPLDEPMSRREIAPDIAAMIRRGLSQAEFHRQVFSWQASILAESLVEEEAIDVIEAQEYDAPLYYFQLRRALGLGPGNKPPVLVHLHSPTEFIVRHNQDDSGRPDNVTAMRMEAFSIAGADAWVCPSRYYADQAASRYGLGGENVRVIPLPLGDTPLLQREKQVWQSGSICYVGRLELRKGIIEWVDAAVSVACAEEDVVFEFVGATLPYHGGISVLEYLLRRIPGKLKDRFLFHGQCTRGDLARYLGRARTAVVPSRWENFPNTCVEAMCTGLPVIATSEGGMTEMILDGHSGWIAAGCRSGTLAEALGRALDATPSRREEMGNRAAADIRLLCDNGRIVEEHLDMRRAIAARGPGRSLHLPTNLPWPDRPMRGKCHRDAANDTDGSGIAVVIHMTGQSENVAACFRSIESQARKPAAVILLAQGRNGTMEHPEVLRACALGWLIVQIGPSGVASAKNAAIEAVTRSGVSPIGFVFIDVEDQLSPDFLCACEDVLRRSPEVGVVSSWWTQGKNAPRLIANPCPALPYHLLRNETASATVVRSKALRDVGGFRENMDHGFEGWDMISAVMATPWSAVTIPTILSKRDADRDTDPVAFRRMRNEFLARFSDVVSPDAWNMIRLLESRLHILEAMSFQETCSPRYRAPLLRPSDYFRLSFPEQMRLLRKAVREPVPAIRFLAWHTSRASQLLWRRLLKQMAGTDLR